MHPVGPDIPWDVRDNAAGSDRHQPLPGTSATPEKNLFRSWVTTSVQQLDQERVHHQAARHGYAFVGTSATQSGPAVHDGGPQRRAEVPGLQPDRFRQLRAFDPTDPPDGVDQDLPLELHLGVDADVLPLAAPTALRDVPTARLDACRGRRHHSGHPGGQVVPALSHDRGDYLLAWEGAFHEHHLS